MSLPVTETLVRGTWVSADDGIEVHDPADNGRTVARVPALTAHDVTTTLAAAAEAFPAWRSVSAFDRAAVLSRAAALLRERVRSIADSIVAENGKTVAEATGEVNKGADFLDYYAASARDGYGTMIHDARPYTRASFHREPLGVIVAITPWNDPLLTPARKLAPALMSGNCVVLKPALATPLSALHLARALHDAGLPPSVLSVVTGHVADIADALLDDPCVAAVTFTGGNQVGDQLRARLAARNVRFQGELGGKNASVVLADADVAAAVDTIVAASFGQAGQRCTATSRLIIDREVVEEVTQRLVERVPGLRLGQGAAADTDMGPLISPAHQDSVLDAVRRAEEQGARLLTGGRRPTGIGLAAGCFMEPTVLDGVSRDMDVWREEVFGPVLAIHEVSGLDEAIDATNDSDYGLSAAVFTSSLVAAERFIDEVDCGQVAVNTSTSGWDVHAPFGGFRNSGSAFKEQGLEALNFYTKVKSVVMHVPR